MRNTAMSEGSAEQRFSKSRWSHLDRHCILTRCKKYLKENHTKRLAANPPGINRVEEKYTLQSEGKGVVGATPGDSMQTIINWDEPTRVVHITPG